nr:MazG-like family protein [Pasteurella testudinis]
MNQLNDNIIQWACARNLLSGSTPQAQTVKLVEELGELAAGVARNNRLLIADSLGDMFVVMTILATQLDLDLNSCVEQAWNEIKDRKGQMSPSGVFIKESDLTSV